MQVKNLLVLMCVISISGLALAQTRNCSDGPATGLPSCASLAKLPAGIASSVENVAAGNAITNQTVDTVTTNSSKETVDTTADSTSNGISASVIVAEPADKSNPGVESYSVATPQAVAGEPAADGFHGGAVISQGGFSIAGGLGAIVKKVPNGSTTTTCHDGTASGMVPCTVTFADDFNKGYLDQTKWSNSYTDFSTWSTDRPVWMPDTFDFIPGGGLRMRTDNRLFTFPDGIPGGGNNECYPNFSTTKCFSGSSITTHGSFSQAYGYFEISTQLYPGPGVFPAFWMLPQGAFPAGPIPSSTGKPISEIDIFEFNTSYEDFGWFGLSGSNAHSNIGYYQYNSGLSSFNPSTGYHKYAMAWTPNQMALYIDDVLKYTSSTAGQLVAPLYLLLDADLGGPGGAPTSSTPFPQYMNVAYVHAYQYVNETAGIPSALDWGKSTVSQQTVNPGDTVTFASTFINNTTYTMGGTVTGKGPHIGISLSNYMNQTQYITGTPSVFDIPTPMTPGSSYPYTFTYTIPATTTLPYGVYNVHWGATTTPAMGYTVYSGGASTRITVVPQTLENLQSLSFKTVSSKPFSGSVTYGNSGKSMQLTGNMWEAAPLTYTVLPATMLEFDFTASSAADTYAIGLFPGSNYNQTAAQKFLFQFAGNTPLGIQSFNHYQNADGTTHYSIPLGDYYTGNMSNLVLVSASAGLNANATFNNVRIYEIPTTLY